MSSDDRRRWVDGLSHVIDQIDRLQSILGDPIDLGRLELGLNAEGAVRCLEVISEAVARLHRADVDLARAEPGIPWSQIRAFGNIVRHDYEAVDDLIVRNTLLADLGPLRAAALRLKARFEAEAGS